MEDVDALSSGEQVFQRVKDRFDADVASMKQETERIKERLHHLFTYVRAAFEEGNEMLLLVTELTVNTYSSRFISQFGCDDYRAASDELMLSERQDELQKEIRELEL